MSHLFLSIAAVSAMANDDPKTPIAPQSSTMRNADMLEAMSQKDTTIKAQDETIIELRNRIVGLQCQLVVARGVVLPSPSDIDTPRSASCTLLRVGDFEASLLLSLESAARSVHVHTVLTLAVCRISHDHRLLRK